MYTPKCPKCDKFITRFNLAGSMAGELGGSVSYHVVAYCCPWCHCVLSVQMDPIALKFDTADEAAKRTAKQLGR